MTEFDFFTLSLSEQIFGFGVPLSFLACAFLYIYWLRGWLLSKRLLSHFSSVRPGNFFNASLFDSSGIFHRPFDVGRYKLAVYSMLEGQSGRPIWYLVVQQSLPSVVAVVDGIYRSPADLRIAYSFDLYGKREWKGKKIYASESLPIKVKEWIFGGWEFAEVSGRDLTVFYQLPDVFGYGRMYEIAKWVLERNGPVNK